MSLPVLFIDLFGLIFGYIYPDLLVKVGVKRDFADSTLSIFILALTVVLGYVFAPFFVYGQWILLPLSGFYPAVSMAEALFQPGSEMFNLAFFLVVGGFVRLGKNLILHRIKK